MTSTDAGDYAAQVRRLIRGTDRAGLSTLLAPAADGGEAWPFGSLVMMACDHDATPVLLMSDLSEHARNLARDPRAALLIDGTAGLVDALTGPRATLLGRAVPDPDPVLRRRYLARHPRAGFYADFTDFRIYRFILERGHLVAGFGKVRWLDAAAILGDAPWRDLEPDLIARFADRAELIARRAGADNNLSGSASWSVIGVDPEGIDLRAQAVVRRYNFPQDVTSADAIEALLATPDSA